MRWLRLISLLLIWTSCSQEPTVFEPMTASQTGIDFQNTLEESDQHNVYQFMNFYTGAGVATGDVNNDGLLDLYFSGNMESGRLYLNQGDFKFTDITQSAGLLNDKWGTGALWGDVNQDGWQDLYVCVSGAATDKHNLLYINQGDGTFLEQAEAYGLDDARQTQHATFIDYDLDGDLDLFLIINPAAYEHKVNIVQPRKLEGQAVSTDVLYRNNGDNTFTDVSSEAGILIEGYSLGVGVSDINSDGWPDIYISNDFIGNDVLYINNTDGTFTDRAADYLSHTSYAGMGNDLADFNNDGLVDIMVLDMRPEDHKRQKLIISSTGYDRFQLMVNSGYQAQYSRNTLQLNRGNEGFSEVGFLTGVSSTDWSWSPLFADYDNDGDRDLFITNGFLRDLGNLDYIHYQNIYDNPLGDPQIKIENKLEAIKNLPGALLLDYLFENQGDFSFEKRSRAWGLDQPSYASGALYADLDNDGDLDLVTNNINQPAHIYRNTTVDQLHGNFLQIILQGPPENRLGMGAKVKLYHEGKLQLHENYWSRGYESSVDPRPHFGLGESAQVDSLEIWWPDGKYQKLKDIPANTQLTLQYTESTAPENIHEEPNYSWLFKHQHEALGLRFKHRENKQNDFTRQPILPKMHAQEGPGMAAADVNGDGWTDLYIGGAAHSAGRLFLYHPDSSFFISQSLPMDSIAEDMGVLIFDAEGDGDQDIYVASGGTAFEDSSRFYQDRLYVNQGNGTFLPGALPNMYSSSSVVTAADYDKDGDLDLFIGGRIVPGAYPQTPQSYLLRNDSQDGKVNFVDITSGASSLGQVGMVTSALWTDYDNDSWQDLIIVGEFMPITIFKNHQGKLQKEDFPELSHTSGWWNSLAAGDFDNDGDIDYMAGNLGINTKYQASMEQPLCIYASDYDKNGRLDPVLCMFIEDKNVIAHTRDELIKQINAMRVRFKTYEEYANATFEESFLKQELQEAQVVKAYMMESMYIENTPDGFRLEPLPRLAQMAPVYGIEVQDFDHDGHLDAMMVGNSFTTEASTGRYDASMGQLLLGNGDGNFQMLEPSRSGLDNRGDAKSLVSLHIGGQGHMVIANNDEHTSVYQYGPPVEEALVQPDETYALIELENGTRRKQEFYYGSGYLSQSPRKLVLEKYFKDITTVNNHGDRRNLTSKP